MADVMVAAAALGGITQRSLNAETAFVAASDASAFRESATSLASEGGIHVTLPPFGLVTIDGNLSPA